MRIVLLALGLVLGSGAIAAACGGDSETDGLCDPGAFIFCRCQNGDEGSKECNGDGASFKPCMAQAGGECPEDTSTTGDPTTTGDPGPTSTSSGPGGGGGTGGGGTGDKEVLEPCEKDDECKSGKCPMGYCTVTCASVQECELGKSECVSFGGDRICMPNCGYVGEKGAADEGINPDPDACKVYGSPSECGFTHAPDGYPVLSCADWGADLKMPPDGTDCDGTMWGDLQCNLGHENPGVGWVCAFSACTMGCYEEKDCPANKNCSQSGQLGMCQ